MANVTTSTWSATGALIPGYYRERFLDGAAAAPMMYNVVFKTMASDRKVEYFSRFAGFQRWGTKTEGGDITMQSPSEGYAESFTNVTYASGFEATREAIEDQQYRELEQLAEDLGIAAADLIEYTSSNILNNGFTATYGDAVALFATTHPLKITGGTEQNCPTSMNDIGYTALEQMIIDMAATTDDGGLLRPMRPDMLVVPPSSRVTAQQILGSEVTSDALQINTFRNSGITLVVWDYLTDSDSYFALDNRHKLYFMWRRPLMFERFADQTKQTEKYVGSMRFVCGPATWRGLYASSGNP